ncbi:MAG: hypothetical protein Q8P66_01315 [Candidatus Colwellbacteria bacterium]|nr:hypothetical protein [Candidatus Colwellbacteria bacterium]
MRFSGSASFALFLVILIAGSLFGLLVLHAPGHYLCPFSSGEVCNGLERMLDFTLHLSYLKIFFLSFFPFLFAFLLGFAAYLFYEKEHPKELYNYFQLQLEDPLQSPQPLLRWLAIHTNSPNL